MKKVYYVLFLITVLRFSGPSAVLAAVERIQSFHSDITVDKTSRITVTETIYYDFGTNARRGIIREIPYVYENKDGEKFKTEFKVLDVVDEDGNDYVYTVSTGRDTKSIKIGDPNQTVAGVHIYVIRYSVLGAITYFSDHDELYWNVTGNDWDVIIDSASASVNFEFSVPEDSINTVCYTGVYGSKDQFCSSEGLAFRTENGRILSPGEGLTLAVAFPKGLVAVYNPERVSDYSQILTALFALYFLITYIILPLFFLYRWYRYGRDPKIPGAVVRTFDPPKNKFGRKLTPIELGALVDEVINPRDISAEIVNLAVKKYIKIKEYPKKLFGIKKGGIEFINLKKNPLRLSKHEKHLLRALFPHNNDSIKMSELKRTFHEDLKDLSDNLYEDMVEGGFFPENPQKVRNKYFVSGLVFLFVFNFPLGILLIILSRAMPKRTAFGAKAKQEGMGLKEFLVSQERQFKFQEKNYYLFEKLLPYAISFGVAKVWAERFSGFTNYKPEWYESDSNMFTPIIFTDILNNNLRSIQGMYTPSSTTSTSGFSSGFGGGGFGGGGFGGGGGSSW